MVHNRQRDTEKDSAIDRRRFMQGVGGVSVLTIVAGCVGDDSASNGENGDGETDFPSEDIRIIIPFSPGGGYDEYARLLARYLPNHLPNNVEIQAQNISGGDGRIALQELNAGDAHDVAIMHVSRFTQQHHIYEDTEYDIREFTWYPNVSIEDYLIGMSPESDVQTWDEFVEGMQAGELTGASTGPTSGGTIATAVLGQVEDLWEVDDVLNNLVTTGGTGESIQLLLSGNADYLNGTVPSSMDFVRDGQLEPLIFYRTEEEVPDWAPDAETFGTVGIENSESIRNTTTTYRAFAGPSNIPEEEAEIMNQAIEDTIQSDEFQEAAEEADLPVNFLNSEETAQTVNNAIETWEEEEELLNDIREQT